MAEQFEQVGVEAIVASFEKFIADLKAMDTQYAETTDGIATNAKKADTATKKSSDGISKAAGRITGNLTRAAGGVGVLVSAIGGPAGLVIGLGIAILGIAGMGKALDKLMQTIGRVAGIISELALSASETQNIAIGFEAMTQGIEGGSKAMLSALQEASAGMASNRDLMKQFNSAAALVSTDFAKSLPEAMELLRKASAATGESLTFLLDSYVRGVGRLSPRILDNMKIQVTLEETTARAAEMFGVAAEATTVYQQQTALTALALERLEEKFGTLPDTALSAAAQMEVFNAQTQNAKDTLGAFFEPAVASVIGTINNLVAAFSEAISEGGILYPILINLGAAFSLAADLFAAAGSFIIDNLPRILSAINNFAVSALRILLSPFQLLGLELDTTLGGLVENVFEWGVKIITFFADGIIAGMNVLIIAMTAIGDVLTAWLAPGSDPKVAPLSWYGQASAEQWLEGFTKADFGILDALQDPLKKVLSGGEFAKLSEALIGGIGAGDRAGVIELITQSAGKFGEQIGKLAKLQFELADATTAVEESEKRLDAARKGTSKAEAERNKQRREFNKLVREGATEAEKEDKQALVTASDDALDAAVAEQQAAQEAMDKAKERQELLMSQADLQKQIVDELIALEQKKQEEAKKSGEASGKAGEAGADAAEDMASGVASIPALGLANKIGDAIQAAKDRIIEKARELFAPLIKKWNELQMKVAELRKAFGTFQADMTRIWDAIRLKLAVITLLVLGYLRDRLGNAVMKLRLQFLRIKNTVITFATVLRDRIKEAINKHLIPALEKLKKFIVEQGEKMFDAITKKITAFRDVLNATQRFAFLLIVALQGLLGAWMNWINRPSDNGPSAGDGETPANSRGGETARSVAAPFSAQTPAMLPQPALATAGGVTVNITGPFTFHTPTDVTTFTTQVAQAIGREMRRE